jgi:tripartite-type tricarboxylate transporter receptor subunit TctC
MVAAAPEVIAVHPSVPAKTMKELVALLKASPGKYNYASPGYGTSPHLASERLFRLSNGADIAHVPFQGGGPAVTATIGGHTQVLHITLPLVSAQIKEGTLRGLAVADTVRSPLIPDVPTLEEAGFPGHEVGFWTALVVPTGTPKNISDWLNRSVADVLGLPDVKERLAGMGFRPLPGTPEALTAHMRREAELWNKIVLQAQIRTN